MKYALLDGKKIEPQKGLRAICPYCGDEVIAKCGSVKIHHWAHKTELKCDNWKEKELPSPVEAATASTSSVLFIYFLRIIQL